MENSSNSIIILTRNNKVSVSTHFSDLTAYHSIKPSHSSNSLQAFHFHHIYPFSTLHFISHASLSNKINGTAVSSKLKQSHFCHRHRPLSPNSLQSSKNPYFLSQFMAHFFLHEHHCINIYEYIHIPQAKHPPIQLFHHSELSQHL